MHSPATKRASSAAASTAAAAAEMSSSKKQTQMSEQSKSQDARIKSFTLVFPTKKTSSGGLKPLRTYHGTISIEVTEPVEVTQLNVTFEGWERVDFGSKVGASRRPVVRTTEDLLQTGSAVVDTINGRSEFGFTLSTPNINFPAAMESAICEISYSITATLVGASDATARKDATACANNVGTLATSTQAVQMAPRVLPSGVGWLKPLIMRDGVMLEEPVKRRFRRQTVQKAMNICVQVRNHCCTLGEAISVDVDATMLQSDRVLTFVRAAVIEQVALKTSVQDEEALAAIRSFLSSQGTANSATVILAERTLNRKVSEIDPSTLANPPGSDWGTSTPSVNAQHKRRQKGTPPLVGLNGIQSLLIRVPRKDVCTADGFMLGFSHVLRLTFGLTSRPSGNGNFDTRYATKDIPLRLVTSKFGDVGRASQAEINKRLSALTMDSDGCAVSEAYGYLLSENSRALRPDSLDSFGRYKNVPSPILLAAPDATDRPYTPVHRSVSSRAMTPLSTSTSVDAAASSASSARLCSNPENSGSAPPDSRGFQYGPLPPIPQPSPTPQAQSSIATPDNLVGEDPTDCADESDESSALYIAESNNNTDWSGDEDRFQTCRQQQRDTLVDSDLAATCSQNQGSSLQSFHSFGSLGSYNTDASSKHAKGLSNASSTHDATTTTHTKEHSSLDSRRSSTPSAPTSARRRTSSCNALALRVSVQSQSDTIVCSPPTEQTAVFGKRFTAVDATSNVPELRLIPSIPAIKTLDEMTRDLFGTDYFA